MGGGNGPDFCVRDLDMFFFETYNREEGKTGGTTAGAKSRYVLYRRDTCFGYGFVDLNRVSSD